MVINDMKDIVRFLVVMLSLIIALPGLGGEGTRHRVIVSTDIGGTDPDDFQSMVHLLLYADVLEIEGLISSPSGLGRKENILEVIELYEQDYKNLRSWSENYPSPDALHAITKQGEVEVAPYQGFREPTEGSDWIVKQARNDDPRPLNLLVWGGIEDLAQALHDAPDIVSRLRVYYIGGPNKKWSPDAFQYIVTQHPDLWIIEANATYRGWFVGGNQAGDWANQAFVTRYIAGHGALGDFFATQLGGTIKMGDSPSVGWLLHGMPADPSQPGWGGQFVPAWARPHWVSDRLTSGEDQVDEFCIFELILPLGPGAPDKPEAQLVIENQSLDGYVDDDGYVHFRFSPKAAKTFSYTIQSNVPSLDGNMGKLTAIPTSPGATQNPDVNLPNWWTDNPAPEFAEGPHIGAKTVSRWRENFLADFADRMKRAQGPAAALDHSIPAGGLSAGKSSDAKNWGYSYLEYPPQWYASDEAVKIANNVLKYQSEAGAWPKNLDLTAAVTAQELAQILVSGKANTIDNNATTVPMRFIALMVQATGDEKYKASFARGLDYLFAAQYANGGWPQFYPLRPDGYFSHITYNDNAMMNVMTLLRDVATGKAPYTFVDEGRIAKATEAVQRGIDCILKTQVRQDGRLTVWAAQHDEVTLAPAWARAYEPPSLSGQESVAIVRFLMEIEKPTPDQAAAIEGAMAWFKTVAIYGWRYQRTVDADGQVDTAVVADPDAGPLWARFYELETNRPLFLGRDSVYKYSLNQVEQERRGGYAYFGSWPESMLTTDYPRWKDRQKNQLTQAE